MKPQIGVAWLVWMLLVGCQQNYELPDSVLNDTIASPIMHPPPSTAGFTKYVIGKGKHYSNNDSTTIVIVKTNALKFLVRFDSSAI
ncbi:MAG: hypothetical protein IBJ16_06680 [Chitinophagaceae bacterium]|nr:hypothetical protein [Chitinophagaceae bacterium]